jgi:hypothetical protein
MATGSLHNRSRGNACDLSLALCFHFNVGCVLLSLSTGKMKTFEGGRDMIERGGDWREVLGL